MQISWRQAQRITYRLRFRLIQCAILLAVLNASTPVIAHTVFHFAHTFEERSHPAKECCDIHQHDHHVLVQSQLPPAILPQSQDTVVADIVQFAILDTTDLRFGELLSQFIQPIDFAGSPPHTPVIPIQILSRPPPSGL